MGGGGNTVRIVKCGTQSRAGQDRTDAIDAGVSQI